MLLCDIINIDCGRINDLIISALLSFIFLLFVRGY